MYHVENVTIGRASFIRRIWESIATTFEIVGYSRAASHLASLGYYDEAKHCMLEISKLKK